MSDTTHQTIVYVGLLGRLILVSALALWFYYAFIDVLAGVMVRLLGLGEATTTMLVDSGVGWFLTYLGAVLFWWRIVKVVVILGSPFQCGVVMSKGRESGGNGRLVTFGHIGDERGFAPEYDGKFLFGVVSRSHPGSDKIVRNRIELLIVALPCEWLFLVQESRFFFQRRNHQSRAQTYLRIKEPYVKSERTQLDTYRKQMVEEVRLLRGALGQHPDGA